MSFLDNFSVTQNSDNREPKYYPRKTNEMTIGSTATHIFNLPFSYSNYVKHCEVIYQQGVELKLIKTDFQVQEENSSNQEFTRLTVKLSPKETGLFKASLFNVYVQIKITNIFNEVSYSTPNRIIVLDSLDNGSSAIYGYLYKNKIDEYLYEIEFDNLDYDLGYDYFKNDNLDYLGACSSIAWDGFLARSYDWNYDKESVFVVRTAAHNGFYATIGVTGSVVGFDAGTNDVDSDKYKILPFRVVDGMNEAGLAMSINVVPSLNNQATITTGSKYDDVCSGMIIRYCLDRFANVDELKKELPKHTSIFPMKNLVKQGYEIHAIAYDENENCVIMEIVDNKLKFFNVLAPNKDIITNFHLYNVITNPDDKVFTPEDVSDGHLPGIENNIESHGSGLERYNFAISELKKINGRATERDMRKVMNGLSYTRAYITSPDPAYPVWNSEFVGNYELPGFSKELTVDNPASDFIFALNGAGELFNNRKRGDKATWFTEHSSIYDIKNRKLYLVNQEDSDKEYLFTL